MAGKRGPRRNSGQVNVDRLVGANIRDLRVRRGLSQEALAADLGVSFQQMRKYETGQNRVTSSRLWDLSRVLQATIGEFFENVGSSAAADAEDDGRTALALAACDIDGRTARAELDLIRAYLTMSPGARTQFVKMVVMLAGGPAPDESA